jgi:signal transduction histidine kinase
MARHIAVVVVISLAAGMVGIIAYRYLTMRQSLEDSARRFASLVSGPLVQVAYMYGDGGMDDAQRQRVARLLELNPDADRIEILRTDGTAVLTVSRNEIGSGSPAAPTAMAGRIKLIEAIGGATSSEAERLQMHGKTVYRVLVPGSLDENVYPLSMVATFNYDRVNTQLQREGLYLALALIVGLGLTERVAALLARGITKNLAQLQMGVRKIRAGRLDERVEIASGDEIEELAEAFNDMTADLQQSIGRLRQANRELHALDQVKIDLVANVSHELRTPLTALKGFLELLDEGELGELNPAAHRAVSVCRRNVDRLTLRVDDLVALSQMEKTWPEQPPFEPFDVAGMIHTVAEIYEVRARAKKLRFTVEAPGHLPRVDGNEEQIERVVINLLDNAVKFTPEQGEVTVAAEECDHDGRHGLLIRVADSGIGIPRNELVRIFDRFHQVDPSIRRRFGGMGLGLSLVHHIVENHGGVVWAESDGGRGATFLVWLPSWSETRTDRHRVEV